MVLGKCRLSPTSFSTEENHGVRLEHKDMGRHILKSPIYHSWAAGSIVLAVLASFHFPVLGSVQGWIRWGFEQPDPVEGVPGHVTR